MLSPESQRSNENYVKFKFQEILLMGQKQEKNSTEYTEHMIR